MTKTSNLAPEQEIEVLRRGLKDADAECWKLRAGPRAALERADAQATKAAAAEQTAERSAEAHITAGRLWDREKERLTQRIYDLTINQVPAPDTDTPAQVEDLKRELAEQRKLAEGMATLLRARYNDREMELDELAHVRVKLMGWRMAAIGAGAVMAIGILLEVVR